VMTNPYLGPASLIGKESEAPKVCINRRFVDVPGPYLGHLYIYLPMGSARCR